MRKLSSLGLVAVIALGIAACATAGELPLDDKPNILLIISDDGGYSDFGFSGQKNFATPRLTELAESGIVFRQAYVTASICSPSRAGLLTGRYQNRFGHEFNILGAEREPADIVGLPVEEVTIADLLKEQGYRTGALGKWHLGKARHFHPLNRGFDFYVGNKSGVYFPDPSRGRTSLHRNFEDMPFDGYMTDILGDEAEAFIERNHEHPFFLYLSYTAVHTPMQSTEEKYAKYPNIENEGRRQLAAMTESLDDSVGGVLDKLEELGIADNTLVIFVNDNGGPTNKNSSINRPLRGAKSSQHEGGIRVPYVLRWPEKLPQDTEFTAVVSALDILPTVMAAAGATPPIDRVYDGLNLLPYIETAEQEKTFPQRELYWKRGARASVRDGDLKLIQQKDGTLELYDIARDPAERQNLADVRTDDVQRLNAKLEVWKGEMIEPVWKSSLKPIRRKKGK